MGPCLKVKSLAPKGRFTKDHVGQEKNQTLKNSVRERALLTSPPPTKPGQQGKWERAAGSSQARGGSSNFYKTIGNGAIGYSLHKFSYEKLLNKCLSELSVREPKKKKVVSLAELAHFPLSGNRIFGSQTDEALKFIDPTHA